MGVAPKCLCLQQVDSEVRIYRIYRNSEEKETLENLEITGDDLEDLEQVLKERIWTGERKCGWREMLERHKISILKEKFFCLVSFSDFGIRVMVASKNEFGGVPPSAIFWKSLRRIVVRFFLNV